MWKRLTLICIALALCFAGGLTGCEQIEPEGDRYQIYYRNVSHTGLISYRYQTQETDPAELVKLLWSKLCEKPKERDEESVVPSDVILLRNVIDGSTLSLYFNISLQSMDATEQLLFRAAVVHTMTAIKEIESVIFYADEKPLTDKEYAAFGAQTASDYVDIIGNGLSSIRKTTLALYYADETGEKLIRKTQDIVYESSYSLERDVVERLIQGPSNKDCYPTLPSDLQLISINVKNGTCYVNFDSMFLTNALPISGYTIVYSIVNSLTELPDVKRVQIMVNGDNTVLFKENISLANPLERNLNY